MGIKFGKTRETKVKGNITDTVETNYREGCVNLPVRHYIEERVRVNNVADEHMEYLAFSDWVHANKKTVLDASWRIEHTKAGDDGGYWFVVKAHTSLDYDAE